MTTRKIIRGIRMNDWRDKSLCFVFYWIPKTEKGQGIPRILSKFCCSVRGYVINNPISMLFVRLSCCCYCWCCCLFCLFCLFFNAVAFFYFLFYFIFYHHCSGGKDMSSKQYEVITSYLLSVIEINNILFLTWT
jgi:hypothetical protein